MALEPLAAPRRGVLASGALLSHPRAAKAPGDTMKLNRLTKRDLLMNHVSADPIAHMLLENRQLIEDDPTDRLGLGFLGVDDGLGYDGDLPDGAIVVESAG